MSRSVSPASFVSGQWRARLLIVFLSVGIAVDLVALLSGTLQGRVLSRETDIESAELGKALLAASTTILQAVVFVATAVVFLVWIDRAYRNLRGLGAHRLRFSPGWAIGAFFVPFLNLVRPYEIVTEIWSASNPDVGVTDEVLKQHTSAAGRYSSKSRLIGMWWAVWILSGIAYNAAFRFSETASTPATRAYMIADVLHILAAAFAILVVRGIDGMQEEKHRRVAASVGPPDNRAAVQGK